MDWLADLPSGAWVAVGALIAGLISAFGVLWQERSRNRRAAAARAAAIADRTRGERRTAYAALLLAAQKADAALDRHFFSEQFNIDGEYFPGIEEFDRVWEHFTGDFDEKAAVARLVASDLVRAKLDEVTHYFESCVHVIVESGRRPSPSEHPLVALEELLARELDYRDPPMDKQD